MPSVQDTVAWRVSPGWDDKAARVPDAEEGKVFRAAQQNTQWVQMVNMLWLPKSCLRPTKCPGSQHELELEPEPEPEASTSAELSDMSGSPTASVLGGSIQPVKAAGCPEGVPKPRDSALLCGAPAPPPASAPLLKTNSDRSSKPTMRDFCKFKDLGVGAYAKVVQAERLSTGEAVAIKIVNKHHVMKNNKTKYHLVNCQALVWPLSFVDQDLLQTKRIRSARYGQL